MSRETLDAILRRPGYSIEGQSPKANPDLGAVGGPQHAKQAPALERDAPIKQGGKSGVACRVEIIGLRRKLLDSDNFCAGAKPLRDAIAASLGIDDGSDRIKFDYTQVVTTEAPGTIVRISWA